MPEQIFLRPLLHKLAISDAVDGYRGGPQVIEGPRATGKIAFVFPDRAEAGHDIIAFGDLVCETVVSGAPLGRSKACFTPSRPYRKPGNGGDCDRSNRRRQPVHRREVALINLLVQPADQGFVVFDTTSGCSSFGPTAQHGRGSRNLPPCTRPPEGFATASPLLVSSALQQRGEGKMRQTGDVPVDHPL